MNKREDESNIQYVERILDALMAVHEIQGVALAIKTRSGTDLLASRGNPPHLEIIDLCDWENHWGR